jgi:glycosyltransferase involved in cell wall biosynthesis
VSLRVVHVITGLGVGGAETALYRILSAMDRRRFDPVVVSLAGDGPVGERIKALDVPVHSIGLRVAPSAPAAFGRFLQLLGELRADLLQGWQYHGSLAAQFAQALPGRRVPVLWNIRHCVYDLGQEKRLTAAVVRLGARLSRQAARLIYVSHTSAFQHEALGYRADRRVVVPNGFDTERFVPSDDARGRLRAELGLPASAELIGKLARYHPVKDHANFLAAASNLRRSHPDVHFVLGGDGVDPSNRALMRLVGSLGLEGRMHLLGPRHDVHRLVPGLDIAVSASSSEAFPNVIGEAMACGVPCVATDVGDSALVIGETGRVVPPRQPRALAEAWRDLLDLGRDVRADLGLRARRRIVEHYALPSVVARYEQLYDELGASAPRDVGRLATVRAGHTSEEIRPCAGSRES